LGQAVQFKLGQFWSRLQGASVSLTLPFCQSVALPMAIRFLSDRAFMELRLTPLKSPFFEIMADGDLLSGDENWLCKRKRSHSIGCPQLTRLEEEDVVMQPRKEDQESTIFWTLNGKEVTGSESCSATNNANKDGCSPCSASKASDEDACMRNMCFASNAKTTSQIGHSPGSGGNEPRPRPDNDGQIAPSIEHTTTASEIGCVLGSDGSALQPKPEYAAKFPRMMTEHVQQEFSAMTEGTQLLGSTGHPHAKIEYAAKVPGTLTENLQDGVTLMIRNLPSSVTQAELLQVLDKLGMQTSIDLMYLPVIFKSPRKPRNKGFAFIHVTSSHEATKMINELHRTSIFDSTKKHRGLNVCLAHTQGFKATLDRWSQSTTNHIRNPRFSPLIFAQAN